MYPINCTEAFTSDLTLNFFKSAEFEHANDSPEQEVHVLARNALRLLIMGWSTDWKQLLTVPVIRAVFAARNPQMLAAMRQAFAEGFAHIVDQLNATKLSDNQRFQVMLYLSNCFSLLPFADINPHEFMCLPQFIDGRWTLVNYRVEPIELTPTKGLRRLFSRDGDRVFAYGFVPIKNSTAEPILVFMGTTYPAGQGFWSQINADLKGGTHVGENLYRNGAAGITAWLDRQVKKPHVCGMSLGGSLALLLAIHQGDRLARVITHNPAGLSQRTKSTDLDLWDSFIEKPLVVVQKQRLDPVSFFGIWKDWSIWHITPSQNLHAPQTLAHVFNFASSAETLFEPVNHEVDNKLRGQRNFWIFFMARIIFYYSILMPTHYLLRPIARFMLDHPLIIIASAAILLAIPLMALSFIIPMFAAMISGMILLYGAYIQALIKSDSEKYSYPAKVLVGGTPIVSLILMGALFAFSPPAATGLFIGMGFFAVGAYIAIHARNHWQSHQADINPARCHQHHEYLCESLRIAHLENDYSVVAGQLGPSIASAALNPQERGYHALFDVESGVCKEDGVVPATANSSLYSIK